MHRTRVTPVAILLGGLLLATSALADKPEWAGKGKHERQDDDRSQARDERHGSHDGRDERRDRGGATVNIEVSTHFNDRQRTYLSDYYADQARQGKCPPGLAKKHNGCMPPGQVKRWSRGRPLPGDLAYYDLPDQLVVQIGRPPAGYRYVRVANDVLLVTVGTMMVVDALEDLGLLGAP